MKDTTWNFIILGTTEQTGGVLLDLTVPRRIPGVPAALCLPDREKSFSLGTLLAMTLSVGASVVLAAEPTVQDSAATGAGSIVFSSD
jgi:hypothetical protein